MHRYQGLAPCGLLGIQIFEQELRCPSAQCRCIGQPRRIRPAEVDNFTDYVKLLTQFAAVGYWNTLAGEDFFAREGFFLYQDWMVYRKRWYLANVKLDMFISILYVNIANLKSVPIEIFAEILNVFMIVRNIRQNSDVFYIDNPHMQSGGSFPPDTFYKNSGSPGYTLQSRRHCWPHRHVFQ